MVPSKLLGENTSVLFDHTQPPMTLMNVVQSQTGARISSANSLKHVEQVFTRRGKLFERVSEEKQRIRSIQSLTLAGDRGSRSSALPPGSET